MKKKLKAQKLNTGKNIRLRNDLLTSENPNTLHPAFCFRHLASKYSLKNCNKLEKAALAVTLQKLGQHKWLEIQSAPRKGIGHEKIAQDSIKVPLPKNTPEDRIFLAFRLNACKQNSVIVGYRQSKVFYITWIDPKGEVYNH